MARKDKRDTEIRAALETICAELAMVRTWMPVTRKRVVLARESTGLTALLSPALDELDDMSKSMTVIGEQVTVALAKLLE